MKLAIFLVAGFMVISCNHILPWRVNYLTEVNNRADQDEIVGRLGPPDRKEMLSDGKEVWMYRYAHQVVPGNTSAAENFRAFINPSQQAQQGDAACAQYILTFSSDKILHNWIRQNC